AGLPASIPSTDSERPRVLSGPTKRFRRPTTHATSPTVSSRGRMASSPVSQVARKGRRKRMEGGEWGKGNREPGTGNREPGTGNRSVAAGCGGRSAGTGIDGGRLEYRACTVGARS